MVVILAWIGRGLQLVVVQEVVAGDTPCLQKSLTRSSDMGHGTPVSSLRPLLQNNRVLCNVHRKKGNSIKVWVNRRDVLVGIVIGTDGGTDGIDLHRLVVAPVNFVALIKYMGTYS
jgi:hypothetical protein